MRTGGPVNIVVVGGGTGTYTVLSGLKKYPRDAIRLAAIVSVADSGGSTGRLRDEFGFLPVGDVRMALAALAEEGNGGNLLRELFLYRFSKGKGLEGHNVGNLLLVALSEILGSTEKAIEKASKVLRVRGKVIPVSGSDATLQAVYEDGATLLGEALIDSLPEKKDGTLRITKLSLLPSVRVSESAKEALAGADIIVLGPGDLYTSILANVVVDGMAEAIRNSKAKLLYVVNLMTRRGQTHGFSAMDHVREISRYIGKSPEYALMNDRELPSDIVKMYEAQEEFPVEDDLPAGEFRVVRGDFLASEAVKKAAGDTLKRSLVRHDSDKLARVIAELCNIEFRPNL